MKHKIILGALVVLLAIGSTAMAGTVNNETSGAGKSIGLSGTTLNFSPGVFGQYTTEGATGNEQWFAIGTYHGGGEKFYATSSQQTVIWKKDRTTVQQFSAAAIPSTKLNSESESQWAAASWSK